MYFDFYIFFILFTISIIFICKKKNIIVDFKLEKHKRYSSKSKSYSVGGLLLVSYLFYYFVYLKNDYLIFTYLSSVFFIGFLSDIKKLNSVSLRFFLQIILILFFSQILNIEIKHTKIEFIDIILSNTFTCSPLFSHTNIKLILRYKVSICFKYSTRYCFLTY